MQCGFSDSHICQIKISELGNICNVFLECFHSKIVQSVNKSKVAQRDIFFAHNKNLTITAALKFCSHMS